jgi:reactive chlorine resistance protein C
MRVRKSKSTLRRARTLETIGTGIARYGLAAVIAVHAAEKFTDFEVNNIKPLLENSPLFSWLGRRIGWQSTARMVGMSELAVASLLALPPRRSRLSALGSILAMGMFGTTLSFLFSTPAARTRTANGVPILSDVGQFLVKDVVLMGVSVLTLGESLHRQAIQ